MILKKTLAVIASGVMVGLASPYWGYNIFAWFCFVPLLLVVDKSSWKDTLLWGFLTQLVFAFMSYFWVPRLFQDFYGVGAVTSWAVFLTTPLYLKINFHVWIQVRRFSKKWMLLVSPLIFVALDVTSLGMLEDTMGFSFFNSPVKTLSSFGGIYFLTFLTYLSQELIVEAIKNKKFIKPLVFLSSVYLIAFMIPEKPALVDQKPLVIFQPNFSSLNSNKEERKRYLVEQLEKDYTPGTILFMPEGLLTFDYENSEDPTDVTFKQVVEKLQREKQVNLFFGYDNLKDKNKGKYNKMIAYEENGAVKSFYKYELMPFAEYNPIGFLRVLDVFAEKKDLSRGKFEGQEMFGKNIWAFICYELFVHKSWWNTRSMPPDFVFNPTNESWFKEKPHIMLSYAVAQLQAVSYNTPVYRTALNGISAVIDNNGKVIEMIPDHERGEIHQDKLLYTKEKSFYYLYPWVWVAGVLLLIGISFVVEKVRKRENNS